MPNYMCFLRAPADKGYTPVKIQQIVQADDAVAARKEAKKVYGQMCSVEWVFQGRDLHRLARETDRWRPLSPKMTEAASFNILERIDLSKSSKKDKAMRHREFMRATAHIKHDPEPGASKSEMQFHAMRQRELIAADQLRGPHRLKIRTIEREGRWFMEVSGHSFSKDRGCPAGSVLYSSHVTAANAIRRHRKKYLKGASQ